MSETEKPTVAFILSLLGGIFLLLRGGMVFMTRWYGFGGMMNGYWGWGGMMDRYDWGYGPGVGMMGAYGFGRMLGIVGILFGVVVIIGALMLYNNPSQHTTWGLVIVIFSALSILGGAMAGLGIGFVLGLIGGIMALTWKPPTTEKK
jgi:hypothetical protein